MLNTIEKSEFEFTVILEQTLRQQHFYHLSSIFGAYRVCNGKKINSMTTKYVYVNRSGIVPSFPKSQ